jgi:hypothetical protein
LNLDAKPFECCFAQCLHDLTIRTAAATRPSSAGLVARCVLNLAKYQFQRRFACTFGLRQRLCIVSVSLMSGVLLCWLWSKRLLQASRGALQPRVDPQLEHNPQSLPLTSSRHTQEIVLLSIMANEASGPSSTNPSSSSRLLGGKSITGVGAKGLGAKTQKRHR